MTEDPPLVKGTASALVWGMGLAEEISMLIGKGASWVAVLGEEGLRASLQGK